MRNYIFDIDGTLSLVGNRVECLSREPKCWDEFYSRCGEDLPNRPVIGVLDCIVHTPDTRLWFLTGRRESCREVTADWLLTRCGLCAKENLLMRPDGDFRHDTIVKPEVLAKAGVIPDVVFEDRNSMAEYWRSQGVCCMQVADGDF